MVRIAGLNKKYFPQGNPLDPLDRILTPQLQAVANKPKAGIPVKKPASMGTVSYDNPNILSGVRDMAKTIAQGVGGAGRFAKRTFENRVEVKQEARLGLDLGMKQTTNLLLGFLSRPKIESSRKSLQNHKSVIDFESKIAPKMREIIAKNNKTIAETPRSFPTSGLSLSEKIKDPRFVFGAGAQQIPNLGAVITAGLATGGTGALATGFILESQSAYEDAKSQGLDEQKARTVSAGVGIVNSVLEVLPILKFLDETPAGKQVKKSILNNAKNIILKTGVQAVEEGGTEYLQEVTANAFAMTYNENRGLFDNAAESGFFGALTGGGVGAASSVVSPNIGLSIKKVEDPLTTEARKYKSAEEFVNSFEQQFHGSPKADLKEIGFGTGVRSSPFMGTSREVKSPSIFFSKDKSMADTFAKNRVEYLATKNKKGVPTVYERFIDKKGILDLTKPEKIDDILEKLKISAERELAGTEPSYGGLGSRFTTLLDNGYVEMGDLYRIFDDPKLIKKFKDAGYNGVRILEKNNLGESTAIFDPKKAFSKSQLTDIWKKANEPKAEPTTLNQKIEKATTKLQKIEFEKENFDIKFNDSELEHQYQSFKKLIPLKQLDSIDDEAAFRDKFRDKVGSQKLDSILYSQESNGTDIFDMFKERRYQELEQRGKRGVLNTQEKVVKKELTKLEKVAKTRQEKKDLIKKIKSIYKKQVAKIKTAKDILARRRAFIRAVREHFQLSDNDLKSITQRDIRFMDDLEFQKHLDNIRIKAEQLDVERQARNVLMAQIKDKELNIEPLRKAMQLPQIHNMSLGQLVEFDKTLEPYQKGDVFLSKRKQEVIHRTELSGIKTYREAREAFNKKHGTDFQSFSAGTLDRLTGNVGLSEKNPFYKEMVEDFYKVMLIREQEYIEIERKTLELTKEVVKTKSLTERILHKFIPQQKNIAAWFDAQDKSTVSINPQEQALIEHIQKHYIDARDYLIKEKQLNHAIDSANYFTHLRRNFLESVKEDGLKTAIKEIFTQQKQDEIQFGITDQKTGIILALEKFFPFALHRSGSLKPSQNVVGAFLTYMKAFKKKQAIDATTPIIMTYADAFTPSGTTKNGLGIDTSLQTFAKEWLNTQRGRRAKLLLEQGGKGEFILRLIKQGISLLYLGGNLTVAAATQVGEQAVTFQLLGNKNFLVAKARAHTKKGKRIVAKYESFIGKNPWSQLIEPARKIGDRAMEGIFILFRDANIRRNKQSLLGMMTKEEYQNETLSPERLAEIRLAVSRYGMVDGAGSILGATPEFQTALQFRSWATQIFGTSVRNLQYISSWVKSKGKLNQAEAKRAFIEVGRIIEAVSFVSILALWGIDDDDDEDMLSKLKKRAYQEATTIMQGANPFTFLSVPPIIAFLDQLSKNLKTLATLEVYTASKFGDYKAGDLKGKRQLERQFTPALIKQFDELPVKTEQDVAKEILDDLKSGKLDEKAAEEKLNKELKKIESKKKEERFKLPVNEYAQDLLDRLKAGDITTSEAEKELDQYTNQDEDAESFDSADEPGFIDKVKTYAEAIGTDPVTAFTFLFQKEIIKRVDNGAIIVWRGKTTDTNKSRDFSLDKRKELGATENLKLDHTIPLQLGGGNSNNNLKLVREEDWESYTPVENYLGDKLRAGLISKKEAQRLIKDFKEGKITKEEVMK